MEYVTAAAIIIAYGISATCFFFVKEMDSRPPEDWAKTETYEVDMAMANATYAIKEPARQIVALTKRVSKWLTRPCYQH